jgi:sporulation protein YlmC with PRC-barrel domain
MWKYALSAAAIAVAGTLTMTAQPPATPPPAAPQPPRVAPAQPAEAVAVKTYRIKQVLGSKLIIQDNIAVGTVNDVVFRDDGYIEYLIVEKNGRLTTVPWEAAKFDFEKQTATVAITNDVYTTIPTYTVKEYPQFHAPVYQAEIYRYYKLTPRQERRLERRP